MTSTVALDLRDVHKCLRGTPVLAGLTMSVQPGTCHAMVGLNGAGKTTALRTILGMLRPDSGTIRIAGHDIATADRSLWRRVGHLVETPFSYPELTARDNITFSAKLHDSDLSQLTQDLEDLAQILRLTDWLDVPVRRLSLGTRQKVGLAAAFIHRPTVIVLDEPTNGLDPLAVVGLRDLITNFVRDGGAALVTSHHFDELARIADRVDVLHRGKIIESFDPEGSDLEQRFFSIVLSADSSHAEQGGRP